MADGHVKVDTGSFQWTYEGREREETVEVSKKDIHMEIEIQFKRNEDQGSEGF